MKRDNIVGWVGVCLVVIGGVFGVNRCNTAIERQNFAKTFGQGFDGSDKMRTELRPIVYNQLVTLRRPVDEVDAKIEVTETVIQIDKPQDSRPYTQLQRLLVARTGLISALIDACDLAERFGFQGEARLAKCSSHARGSS